MKSFNSNHNYQKQHYHNNTKSRNPRQQYYYSFTKEDIIKAISKSTFNEKQVNENQGVYLWNNIIEEIGYIRNLILSVNNKFTKTDHARGLNNVSMITNFFNPVKNYWNPNKMGEWNNLYYTQNVINPDFTLTYKRQLYYHNIFNLYIPLPKRTITIHTLTIEDWSLEFWLSLLSTKIKSSNIDFRTVNNLLLIYTECTRVLINNIRITERKEHIKNSNVKFDENSYWTKVDNIRNIIIEEKSLDIRNPKIFKVITELINGSPMFYSNNLNYPCINLISPNLCKDFEKQVKWCFTHIEEQYFDLIYGILKQFSQNPTAPNINLTSGDSEGFIKVKPTTQVSLMRDLMNIICVGGASKEYKKKRLNLVNQLIDIVLKINPKDIIQESNTEIMDLHDNPKIDYLISLQDNIYSVLATSVLCLVDHGSSLLSIETVEEAKLADSIIEKSVEMLKTHGLRGGEEFSFAHQMLSFYQLIDLKYTDGDYPRFFYIICNCYIPKKFHEELMKDEYYKEEFEFSNLKILTY